MKPKLKSKASAMIFEMLSVNNPVPLDHEVDRGELMRDLIGAIKTYVVISDHAALAVALWAINTWCYEQFARCPLLLINAPERECGKTQLLKVVEMLVHKPIETANITLAALFRLINNYKPTLLIDEADTFMQGKNEMAGVVNKGYERGGVVLRVESDGKELVECAYQVHGPKAMAGIMLERHLQDATMSRGIQIPLKRKTKDDSVKRLRSADPMVFSNLRSRIKKLVDSEKATLVKGWSELPESLSDRQQDNWESLLAIAHCFGNEWYAKAHAAAVQNCIETTPPKSSSNQLLEDIREVLSDYERQHIPSVELLDKLTGNQDMDWCSYNHGQPIKARQLAKFMSAYGIKTKTVRMRADYTPKGYEVREFEDAFARYLTERKDEPKPENKAPPLFGKPPIPNF
ncbi:DUF3631 domain-containing protein [Acidovorax sp. Be4]|uniref:DUF3631 domain-containing protein n=1 Tax=Acidovorax bellezanensis TaxID=2976702 RepID=A0ABT2PP85_9BURK|nr:DUF3631 domain-containing protein [Acidovorax sp. Be4]MCT9812290.1 DUF3631 domain-containing protein [Acidovorax sp. Be4]